MVDWPKLKKQMQVIAGMDSWLGNCRKPDPSVRLMESDALFVVQHLWHIKRRRRGGREKREKREKHENAKNAKNANNAKN